MMTMAMPMAMLMMMMMMMVMMMMMIMMYRTLFCVTNDFLADGAAFVDLCPNVCQVTLCSSQCF